MTLSHRRGVVATMTALVAVASLALAGCSSAAGGGAGSTGSQHDYTGPAADSAEAAALIESAGQVDNTDWCGTGKITVGVEDPYGANGWSASSYAAVRSELAKCSNVTQIVSAGQGDLNAAIQNTNADVSQGAAAIVILPLFGESQLPSIQAATKAGVKVVPWAQSPGGTVGKDYVDAVLWNAPALGTAWAEWMAKQLNGKGNLVYLGGPAGNQSSADILSGIAFVAEKNPGLKLLTGKTDFVATNWDQSKGQSEMAALIAKYPQIDGVITDDSSVAAGALAAFTAAGRALPLIASVESNQLACAYQDAKATHPELQLATSSARNWLGRIAARKAVAAAQGLPEDSPSSFNLPIYEDSVNGPAPQCDKSASPSTFFSNQISAADLAKYGKSS
ncbi:hypothetical protein BH11ACT4_BH11ACT4_14630 [soil metagenome]